MASLDFWKDGILVELFVIEKSLKGCISAFKKISRFDPTILHCRIQFKRMT